MSVAGGGGDEQFPVGGDEQDPDRSSRLGLDEWDPVEGWMNRTTLWWAG